MWGWTSVHLHRLVSVCANTHRALCVSTALKEWNTSLTSLSKGCRGKRELQQCADINASHVTKVTRRFLQTGWDESAAADSFFFQKQGENFGWIQNRKRMCRGRSTSFPTPCGCRQDGKALTALFPIIFIDDFFSPFFFFSCQEFPRSDLNWQWGNPANKYWVRSQSLIHLSHRWPLCF